VPEARVRIVNGNWGGTGLRAVHDVLQTTYDVLTEAFGNQPDATINVARWGQSPRVFFDQRPYEVRISSQDTYWCQYVYQFSHELCHIMTNFDQHRTHPYKWFEEALCELGALFVLHRISDAWMTRPPSHVFGAREYAPSFRNYAQDIIGGHAQPGQTDLPKWLDEHIAELEAEPCIRELNRCVAIALLDHFLEDPSLWRDCGQLNHWDAGTNGSFREYLAAWSTHVGSLGGKARVPALISRLFLDSGSKPVQ